MDMNMFTRSRREKEYFHRFLANQYATYTQRALLSTQPNIPFRDRFCFFSRNE
jgi:hypothetical protein